MTTHCNVGQRYTRRRTRNEAQKSTQTRPIPQPHSNLFRNTYSHYLLRDSKPIDDLSSDEGPILDVRIRVTHQLHHASLRSQVLDRPTECCEWGLGERGCETYFLPESLYLTNCPTSFAATARTRGSFELFKSSMSTLSRRWVSDEQKGGGGGNALELGVSFLCELRCVLDPELVAHVRW